MKTPPARLLQMKRYHERTRTPERKEVLARRSREYYHRNPEKCRASGERYKQKHRQKILAKRNQVAQNIRDFIIECKAKPCADCNVCYPSYVMDFDHVTGTKLFCIGQKACSRGLWAVAEEIQKCEVVCGNCHRERTHQRKKRTHGPDTTD